MAENNWHLMEDGKTIGTKGSEKGVILRDEEHPLGARITLERDCVRSPYAITCGIYGSMMHTAFAGNENDGIAKYSAMRSRLIALMAMDEATYYDELSHFVKQF